MASGRKSTTLLFIIQFSTLLWLSQASHVNMMEISGWWSCHMLDKNIRHDHVSLKSTHDPTRCWTSTTTCSSSLKSRCPPILLANRWHKRFDKDKKHTRAQFASITKTKKEITKTVNWQKTKKNKYKSEWLVNGDLKELERSQWVAESILSPPQQSPAR